MYSKSVTALLEKSKKLKAVLKKRYGPSGKNFKKLKNILKSMRNIMECKRDNFSGAFDGARETHRKCVSHRLKKRYGHSGKKVKN